MKHKVKNCTGKRMKLYHAQFFNFKNSQLQNLTMKKFYLSISGQHIFNLFFFFFLQMRLMQTKLSITTTRKRHLHGN